MNKTEKVIRNKLSKALKIDKQNIKVKIDKFDEKNRLMSIDIDPYKTKHNVKDKVPFKFMRYDIEKILNKYNYVITMKNLSNEGYNIIAEYSKYWYA